MSHWPHQCLTVKAFTQKSSRDTQALWKELYKRLPGLLLKSAQILCDNSSRPKTPGKSPGKDKPKNRHFLSAVMPALSHWPHQCLKFEAWRLKSTKSWGSKGPLNFYYIGHLNPKFHPFIFKTAETTFSLFLKMHFYFFLYFVSVFEIQNWRHSSGSGKGREVAPPVALPPFPESHLAANTQTLIEHIISKDTIVVPWITF